MVPYVGPKDVRHHVAEIQQDPSGVGGALDAQGAATPARQRGVDVVGDGLDLTLGFSRADDQVVGDGGQLRNVQDEDVGGFLFQRRLGDRLGFYFRVECDRGPPETI